jgi:hypothetical protein
MLSSNEKPSTIRKTFSKGRGQVSSRDGQCVRSFFLYAAFVKKNYMKRLMSHRESPLYSVTYIQSDQYITRHDCVDPTKTKIQANDVELASHHSLAFRNNKDVRQIIILKTIGSVAWGVDDCSDSVNQV